MTGEVPKVPQAQSTVLLSPPQVQSCVGYLVAHLCLTGNERDVLGAFNLIKQTRVTTEKGTVPQDRVGIVAWSGFVITKTPCPPPSCFLPQFMCQLTQKTRFWEGFCWRGTMKRTVSLLRGGRNKEFISPRSAEWMKTKPASKKALRRWGSRDNKIVL